MNGRFFSLAWLLLVICTGCGSSEELVEEDHKVLNFVRGGAITLNGKDIPSGAVVTLHPKAGATAGQPITGKYNADESYFTVITVKDGEQFAGAPEGAYTMTLQPPRNKPAAIPKKYQTPATSDLLVEVKSGSNMLAPIQLQP